MTKLAEKPFPREIAPPSHREWLREQEDAYSQLETQFAAWIKDVACSEEIFKRQVRENPEMNDSDVRQHRMHLCRLMMAGEHVAFEFLSLNEEGKSVENYVRLIDEKVEALRTEFIEWHTPEGFADPVPDSFKEGMRDAKKGKLVEFPDAKA